MGLYERWTASDDSKIPVHTFATALREMARGAPQATRNNIIATFELSGDDITELDAIRNKYLSLSASDRAAYLVLLHDVMILSEAGLYSRSTASSRLGF